MKNQRVLSSRIHTPLLWLMPSLRQHNSTVKGSCRGFWSNFFCSMGLKLFHSLTNAKRTSLYAGLSFTGMRVVFLLLSTPVDCSGSSSSGRKFSKRGLGLESIPGMQEYKWILPVYWLTWKSGINSTISKHPFHCFQFFSYIMQNL